MPGLVYKTAVASLAVQVLATGLTVAGFFLPLPASQAADLQFVLALETASQAVEFAWYCAAVCCFGGIRTWTRYLDWAISTPAMLVSATFFFRLRRGAPLLVAFEGSALYAVLGLNWLMLAFGFAAEYGAALPRAAALPLGSAAFAGSYALLAREVDFADGYSLGLYASMAVTWGLYGVAAALGEVPKNVAYNGLDLVSKNVYGVFLFAYAFSLS